MSTTTRGDRVRSKIETLATTGLDAPTFISTAADLLTRAVPFSAACIATADPATQLVTGTWKLALNSEHDEEWARLEYEVPDVLKFLDFSRRGDIASTAHFETEGDLSRSPRHVELLDRHYSLHDELRVAFRADGATWGFACLFRESATDTFSAAEVDFVAGVSSAFATGLRAGMLVGAARQSPIIEGPAVIVIGADDQVAQATIGAQERVTELAGARSVRRSSHSCSGCWSVPPASSPPVASPTCRAPAPARRQGSGSSRTRRHSPGATATTAMW